MAKKAFRYRGKNAEEMKKMSLTEFMALIPARERRSLKKGFTEDQKSLIHELEKNGTKLKTHCRDMVIIPLMIGKTINVYSGKSFEKVFVTEEMMGHRLGEFVLTRKKLQHSAPGIGATKSSGAISVK